MQFLHGFPCNPFCSQVIYYSLSLGLKWIVMCRPLPISWDTFCKKKKKKTEDRTFEAILATELNFEIWSLQLVTIQSIYKALENRVVRWFCHLHEDTAQDALFVLTVKTVWGMYEELFRNPLNQENLKSKLFNPSLEPQQVS